MVIPFAPNEIESISGRHVDLAAPTPEMVDLEDVAWALAGIRRFTAHCRKPYSVAQHSVHVCELLAFAAASPRVQLLGLLHDGSEWATGDISRPLKGLLAEFAPIEARLQEAVERALWVDEHGDRYAPATREERTVVKWADDMMLAAEAGAFMPSGGLGWNLLEDSRAWAGASKGAPLVPWPAEQARLAFLRAYIQLCPGTRLNQTPQEALAAPPGSKRETILQEAQRIVHTDRGDDYGHPAEDFACTAAIISACLHRRGKLLPGAALEPQDVAAFLLAVKLSRQAHRPKRDNLVDLAGYAATIEMIEDRQNTQTLP